MIHPSASKAIAAARLSSEPIQAAATPENWATLFEAASERWTENGAFFFSCAERGDEWTVFLASRPPSPKAPE